MIAILGAGAWGTALAIRLAARFGVMLWARDAALVDAIERTRSNERYLPGVALPPRVRATADLDDAIRDADCRIVATTVAGLIPTVSRFPRDDVALLWLCKGFVIDGDMVALPHEAVQRLGFAHWGLLSGPSFAQEVATHVPTALTLAGCDIAFAEHWSGVLRDDTLRLYASDDAIGVETGGAVKNVLAIATGICDGLELGDNARAALITRGLAEIGRLAEALGGRRDTVMGLSGLGDLVLTCTGNLSRNRQVGLQLAAGRALDEIHRSLHHVAEGVTAARAVAALARRHRVDMPICDAVYRVLYDGLSPRDAVSELLRREPSRE